MLQDLTSASAERQTESCEQQFVEVLDLTHPESKSNYGSTVSKADALLSLSTQPLKRLPYCTYDQKQCKKIICFLLKHKTNK